MSLIAAQALRGKKIVSEFIKSIKRRTDSIGKDVSSVLAENTLKTVWDTLNRKQQILLRFMSETVKAETENNLSEIIKPELNYNQFSKALKTLNNLNLIVVKSSPNEPDLLELHPLVKEFIKHKYPMTERSKYIALFVNHFNRIILVLKPQLSHDSPLYVFENWTHKIELEINKRDFKNALISLQEISNPIRTAGYIEEFLRVCHMFYIEVDWPSAITEEYSYFHGQFNNFVKILIELGRYNDADTFLKKYSRSISGKGIHYLSYCDLRCYYYWYKEDFTNAIIWGEKGSDLKLKSEIDTGFDPTHNLALALRDSRIENNLTKALNYFLLGEVLEDVLADKLPEENFYGSFYGNIGRCLQFQGNSKDALWCYKKSLKLLMTESSTNTQNNIGYACKWIAEILSDQEDYTTAYIFNKKAYIQWKEISPPRAKIIEIILTDIIHADKVTTDTIKLNEWQIEKHFNGWLSM